MNPPDSLVSALADRYTIERELGEGGMATVYLATDLKHNRQVAIKVLKDDLAAVVGEERFLAEIETTAQLQHPHILPLFDSGAADGFLYYAMPYVEGETLRDRLKREVQLPVEHAVELVQKIAAALDYAHERGIVHRDIKPENILLSSGEPLIADFGIALAVSQANDGRRTETGISLGTPYYMSPEQAAGDRSLDPRSDIYALGCVLQELLTGEPPFSGANAQAVLARILTTRPTPVTSLRPTVPPHVESAIGKALEKLPADRFTSAKDFRQALSNPDFRHTVVERTMGSTAVPTQTRIVREGVKTPLVAAAVVTALVAGAVAGATLLAGGSDTGPGYRVLGLGSIEDSLTVQMAHQLSPDGRLLASVDMQRQLRIIPLDDSPEIVVPGPDRADRPRFSLDGSRIGFVWVNGAQPDGAELFWLPSTGSGTPSRIGGLPNVNWAWGPGGAVYFTRDGNVVRYPAPGVEEERMDQPDDWEVNVLQVIPDGRVLVEVLLGSSGNRIALLDPETGQVTEPESQPDAVGIVDARYHSGHLFWTNEAGILYAARFEPDGAGVLEPRVQLARGVAPASGVGSLFSVAEDGSMIVGFGADARAGAGENVGWVDLDGNVELIHEPWAEEFQDFDWASPSPNDRWMAVEVDAGARDGGATRGEIWVLDSEQKQSYRLTLDGEATMPQWLDDDRVAYVREDSADGWRIVAQPYDRSGTEEVLFDPGETFGHDYDVLPDGAGLIVSVHDGETDQDDLWIQPFDGSPAYVWFSEPFDEVAPVVSPNGEWLAYSSDESGRNELYVRSFPTPGRPWKISDEGAEWSAWNPDGEWLYFGSGGALQARLLGFDDGVTIQGGGDFFSLDGFERGRTYLNRAGDRFLMTVEPGTASDIELEIHLGVFDEITRRIEVGSGR